MNGNYPHISPKSCSEPSESNRMIQPVLSVDAVYNHYQIVDRLGQGGSGTVYLVVPKKEFSLLQAYHNDIQRNVSSDDKQTSRSKEAATKIREDLAETIASPAPIPDPSEHSERVDSNKTRFAAELELQLSREESDNDETDAFNCEKKEVEHTFGDKRQSDRRQDYIPRSTIRKAVTSGVIHAFVLKHIVFTSEFDPKHSSAQLNDPENVEQDDSFADGDSIATFEKELLDLIKASPEGYMPVDSVSNATISFTTSRDLTISPASLFRAFMSCTVPRRRALCEALCLASLQHPHIISLASAFIAPSGAALLIEWGAFGDLDRYLRAARTLSAPPISEFLVTRCIAQLALALSNLHSNRILHRDLKSPNIFLSLDDKMFSGPDCKTGHLESSQTDILRLSLPKIDLQKLRASSSNGEDEGNHLDNERDVAHTILANCVVKIGDFGTAHTLSGTEDQAKTQIGTPFYLSPEICEGKAYGTGSDIWALGIISFELMTFNRPFVGTNIAAVVYQIISKSPPAISEDLYSKPLRKLVRQMLAKDPSKRPSADKILKHAALADALNSLQAEQNNTSITQESRVVKSKKAKKANPQQSATAEPDAPKGNARPKRPIVTKTSAASLKPTVKSTAPLDAVARPTKLYNLNVSGKGSSTSSSKAEVNISNAKSGTLRKGRPSVPSSAKSESKIDTENFRARVSDGSLVVRPSLSSSKSTKSSTEKSESRLKQPNPGQPASRGTLRHSTLKKEIPSSQQLEGSRSLTVRSSSRSEYNGASSSAPKTRLTSFSGKVVSGSVARTHRAQKCQNSIEQSCTQNGLVVVSQSGDTKLKSAGTTNQPPRMPSGRVRIASTPLDPRSSITRLRKPEPPWQCSDCYFLNQPVRTTCMCCSSSRHSSQTARPNLLEVERVMPRIEGVSHMVNQSETVVNAPVIETTRRTSMSWRDLHTIASHVRQSIGSLPIYEPDEELTEDEEEDVRENLHEENLESHSIKQKYNDEAASNEDMDSLYADDAFEEESEPHELFDDAVGLVWECPNCRIAYEIPENQNEARCSMCDAHSQWDNEGTF